MAMIRREDHDSEVKSHLLDLMINESYWNVIMFCKDGAVAHNRLVVGLVFPQLTDEISVICPDHSVQDVANLITNILGTGSGDEMIRRESDCVDGRDKYVLSHVMDTDLQVFHPHHPEPEQIRRNEVTENSSGSDDHLSNIG